MSIYLNILGFHIPSYGLMITLGVILANVFALYPLKKYKLIFDDFLILEAYTLLGAFTGAKLLYLIISYREIDWSRFLEPKYFNYIILWWTHWRTSLLSFCRKIPSYQQQALYYTPDLSDSMDSRFRTHRLFSCRLLLWHSI